MVTCWECEASPERLLDVTIDVPAGRACHLRLCPSCYQACYRPLVDMAGVELLHDVAPAAMPTVEAVRAVLLHIGEQPATQRTGGFDARDLGGGFIAVRWHPPSNGRTSDAGLAFLEEYARLLRDAGIRALITTEDGDPRVLCSPGPVPGRRRGPGDPARRAG